MQKCENCGYVQFMTKTVHKMKKHFKHLNVDKCIPNLRS